jgi:hypothetical protein
VLAMMAVSAIGFIILGRHIDGQFEAVVGNSAAPIASAASGERDLNRSCPAPTVQRPWNGTVIEMSPMLGSYLMEEFSKYQGMAEYSECIMQRHVERLCDAGRKKQLIADLKTYLSFHGAVVRMASSAQRLPASTWEAVAAQSNPEYRENAGLILNHVKEADADVMRRIRKLAKNGYLTSKDFGVFGYGVPARIAPHLVLSEPAETACQ